MKEMKQEGCNDREAGEGRGRRRTYSTFSPLSHAGHRAVDHIEAISPESPRKM